jgi:hypothetical protein
LTLVILAIAGAMALLLGLIGIYGVIAYAVSEPTREIGRRLALGALPADVRQMMFVHYGLGLCGIGITIGVGASAALARDEIVTVRRDFDGPNDFCGCACHAVGSHARCVLPAREESVGGGPGGLYEKGVVLRLRGIPPMILSDFGVAEKD